MFIFEQTKSIQMKRILVVLAVVILMVGCNKDEAEPQPLPASTQQPTPTTTSCSSVNTLLTGKDWVSLNHPFINTITIRYETDGKYYENGTHEGSWSLTPNCDTILGVSTQSWTFTNYIVSISQDTLVVNNSIYGQLTYTNGVLASKKFFVKVDGNYGGVGVGNHQVYEIVPDVSVEGVPLTYTGLYSQTDAIFEYEIPTTLNVNCNDTIDFAISISTDSLSTNSVIMQIETYYKDVSGSINNIISSDWVGGSNSWYHIDWNTPNPIMFNYNNKMVKCY